ncbi:MAG: VanZ family protein [Candidatus Binatia bacterium]|nr:VanZ family protein [Candidatus Binatia bacterium]
MQPPPESTPSMVYHWLHWLRYWAVVGLWMACISALSTDPFSAQNTHRYIDPVLRWLFPDLSPRGFVLAHTVIRKTAHFVEFFILGLLVYWATRRGRAPRWRLSWSLQAVTFSGVWALLDELHQAFVITRTASLWDSAIDTLGAAAGQAAIYFRSRYGRKGRRNHGARLASPPPCD